MQRRTISALVVGTAAVLGVLVAVGAMLYAQSNSPSPSIVGVWKVTERPLPGGRTLASPQPGIRIYTRRHYSFTEDTSEGGRPELPTEGATDKQRLDVFGPFTAQAGTYEIRGNELTYRRIAAKNPNNLRPGAFTTVTFRFEGNDTLWITGKANQNGPIADPTTLKLTRLE
jgi:hypothetical protein